MTTFLSYKNSIFWIFQKTWFYDENSISGHENGFPDTLGPSPTTKNPENGQKTPKNPKIRKFRVGGRREAPSISVKGMRYKVRALGRLGGPGPQRNDPFFIGFLSFLSFFIGFLYKN